jgi:hypothetical protein
MSEDHAQAMRVRWARLRFAIIGPLLSSPPLPGQLADRLRELSQKSYQHPSTKLTIRFGASSIERWYYQAKDQTDPLAALMRKVPAHAGTHRAVGTGLRQMIAQQYQQYPSWTFQLHYDNLLAQAKEQSVSWAIPSYPTVRRYMRDQGLFRQRNRRGQDQSLEQRHKRSYEVTHVHQLWHLDFHQGSRKVLTSQGQWHTPMLLGVLDDHSRLCCHLQWYLDETAESLIHGLCQAIAKRGLPRALMTDNGAAMLAGETTEGLERLGIQRWLTPRNKMPSKRTFGAASKAA